MSFRSARRVESGESSFHRTKPAMVFRLTMLIGLLSAVVSIDVMPQQATRTVITGRVTDVETGEPLENVNIFLSFTTIGTSTDSSGSFVFTRVPLGMFDLVVSRIGYERQVISLRVVQRDSLDYNIRLKPQALQMQGVEITAEKGEEWKKNLERFVNEFIGEVDNAENCKILNPEVLDLHFVNDTLICKTDSILLIDNQALGYRLHIVLADFVWDTRRDFGYYLIYPVFESLQASDAHELFKWESNRKQALEGSIKHFLRSLYWGNSEAEMFTIFTGPLRKLTTGRGHRVSSTELHLEQLAGTPFKTLYFPGYLRVEYGRRIEEDYIRVDKYKRERERVVGVEDLNSVSIIALKISYAIIDSLGNLLNPLSIEVSGGWAKNRIAKLQPMY